MRTSRRCCATTRPMSCIRPSRRRFFQGAIRMFQREKEMRNIVLSDSEAREKATRHFFNRALREVREVA